MASQRGQGKKMRKQILTTPKADAAQASPAVNTSTWLDLQEVASVQLSSEDSEHPFENALEQSSNKGWRASAPGLQLIRLGFDKPQSIRGIHVEFREEQQQRSQEFAVYVTTSDTQSRREVVRQQWNFSAGDSSVEIEDYTVDLRGVSLLELEIDPGRHDKQAIASLQFIAIAGGA